MMVGHSGTRNLRTLIPAVALSALVTVLPDWGTSLYAQGPPEVVEAGIGELAAALDSGRVSSVDLVRAYLDRIAAYDQQGPVLNSIIRVNPRALEQAAALDAERVRGTVRGPLHGIPILVKDNYNTTFMPTTGGSVALADFVPSANATQIDRLLQAGAIVLAKTNLHEFAYGITTVGSLRGQTRNPYDIRRVPGGSSGGTGAAVAASFGAVGLGSDTCGSIRIPAAYNNLVGLRPSKGLSSIHGIMPLAHTQDVAGPLARSLADLATVLDIVSGFDSRDEATAVMEGRQPLAFSATLGSVAPEGLRLGRLAPYMERADGATRSLIDAALAWYTSQGAEVVDVDLAGAMEHIGASGVIGHEFRSDLNQYLSLFVSEDILNLNDIVDLGLYHEAVGGVLRRRRTSVHNQEAYMEARAARQALRWAIESVLNDRDLDAIVYPPIAEQPVFIGSTQPGNNCSLAANSGLPALSVPVGLSEDGLPVGMELLGAFLDDARLLAIAYPYEQAHDNRRAPEVTPPLVDGRAPPPQLLTVAVNAAGLTVNGRFSVDGVGGRLSYRLEAAGNDRSALHAAVLVIDGQENFGLNEPAVANLLGPQQSVAAGDIFLTPPLRQAIAGGRLYLKVFAAGVDSAGVTGVLAP